MTYNDVGIIVSDTYYPFIEVTRDVWSKTQHTYCRDPAYVKYITPTRESINDIVAFARKYRKYVYVDPNARLTPVQNSCILELTRLLSQPVLKIYHNRYAVLVDKNIPRLTEYGFHNNIDAEQLYQNLEYWFGNLRHTPSPDLAPPVTLSDKDRIVQHGFDLKQSFRHRKD